MTAAAEKAYVSHIGRPHLRRAGGPSGGEAEPPPRVIVLGEALCDLYPAALGESFEQTDALHLSLGGAPANVSVQLARLGVDVALWTAVGRDPLSRRTVGGLAAEGVDTAAIRVRDRGRIGLTLVEVDAAGERRFTPFREGSCDQTLAEADLPLGELRGAAALLHGTVSLRSPTPRTATQAAVRAARAAGARVVLDVNLRPGMYDDLDEMHALARAAVREAHVVKATREEAQALYGEGDDDALVRRLLAEGPELVLLTFGEAGARVATRRASHEEPAAPCTAVDATGAGDAFLGAAVFALLARLPPGAPISPLTDDDLAAIARAATWAGARATEHRGATPGMPRRAEVLARMDGAGDDVDEEPAPAT